MLDRIQHIESDHKSKIASMDHKLGNNEGVYKRLLENIA
jgi:hypothetical protein